MNFVALRESVGLKIHQFLDIQGGRAIVIWGAGFLGKCTSRRFLISGFTDFYMTDSFKNSCEFAYEGRGTLTPDSAIEMARTEKAVILIAIQPLPNSLKRHLTEAGLIEGKHFKSIQKLSRPSPVIDIFDPLTDCSMTVPFARSVAAKISDDFPDVFNLDLFSQGYSLCNPEASRIISVLEEVAPCSVGFRLSDICIDKIRSCVDVGVSQMVCVVDENSLSSVESAFESLAKIYRYIKNNSLTTEIRVRFDFFENDLDTVKRLKSLCAFFELPFIVGLGYPKHYDALTYISDDSDSLSQVFKPLAWSLSHAKQLAVQDKDMHCLCERVFPVVDASGAARLCHLYTKEIIDSNYISLTRAELFSKRSEASHCRICQRHGLHRLDVSVLERRHKVTLTSSEYRQGTSSK